MMNDHRLVAFIPVSDAEKTRSFYRDRLGLRLLSEDRFALSFDVKGAVLRATLIPQFTPQPFTVLGWQVPDAASESHRLASIGIELLRYPGMEQDEIGLWRAPGGALIGWFHDPDRNVLSITQLP